MERLSNVANKYTVSAQILMTDTILCLLQDHSTFEAMPSWWNEQIEIPMMDS